MRSQFNSTDQCSSRYTVLAVPSVVGPRKRVSGAKVSKRRRPGALYCRASASVSWGECADELRQRAAVQCWLTLLPPEITLTKEMQVAAAKQAMRMLVRDVSTHMTNTFRGTLISTLLW